AFEDQNGYLRLAVDKRRKLTTPLYTCNSLLDGRNLLNKLIEEFELCPKLCFVQTNNEPCTSVKQHICAGECMETPQDYNRRVNLASEELKEAPPTMAIRDERRNS